LFGKLATSLRIRYEAYGRAEDIDEMVVLARAAVSAARAAHYRTAALGNLASVLHTRFEANLGAVYAQRWSTDGRPADLHRAVSAFEQAAAAAPVASPERAEHRVNQGPSCSVTGTGVARRGRP
jgi:hypothetical protein